MSRYMAVVVVVLMGVVGSAVGDTIYVDDDGPADFNTTVGFLLKQAV